MEAQDIPFFAFLRGMQSALSVGIPYVIQVCAAHASAGIQANAHPPLNLIMELRGITVEAATPVMLRIVAPAMEEAQGAANMLIRELITGHSITLSGLWLLGAPKITWSPQPCDMSCILLKVR